MDSHRSGDLQSKLVREGLAERVQIACNAILFQTNCRSVWSRVAAITLSASSREAVICLLAMIIVATTVPKPARSAKLPVTRVCQWSSQSQKVV